jgi:hypothetical protein
MLENDTRGGPPNSTMYECPLNRCPWRHQRTDQPTTCREHGEDDGRLMTSVTEVIAETIRRANAHDEAILRAHLATHSAVEWAETVAELRAELAAARAPAG